MTKKLLTLRVEPADLERIDAAASAAGLTRTAYILHRTLGRLAQVVPATKTKAAVDLSRVDVAGWRENRAPPGSRLKQPKKRN